MNLNKSSLDLNITFVQILEIHVNVSWHNADVDSRIIIQQYHCYIYSDHFPTTVYYMTFRKQCPMPLGPTAQHTNERKLGCIKHWRLPKTHINQYIWHKGVPFGMHIIIVMCRLNTVLQNDEYITAVLRVEHTSFPWIHKQHNTTTNGRAMRCHL